MLRGPGECRSRWRFMSDSGSLVAIGRSGGSLFTQIIRGRVSDPKAVDDNFRRWSKELAPGAVGWLGTTGGVTEDGQLFIMVRVESEEAARANSERPEQDQFWSETSKQFDGEPTFQDSTDVTTGRNAQWTAQTRWQPATSVCARIVDRQRQPQTGLRRPVLG